MKIHVVLAAALLTVGSVFADSLPSVWPMPTPPKAPDGTNSAAYPKPQGGANWRQWVLGKFNRARSSKAEIQLIFDGDSITCWWQNAGNKVWIERYARLNAFDFGMCSDRTENVLWRLSQGQVQGINPKLIAIMIGTNNIGNTDDVKLAEGIKAVVMDYQKRCPNAVILLQGILPSGEKPTDPKRLHIKAVNGMISRLGDGKKVIYLDFGDKFLSPDGTLSKDVTPDFLHPTEKGYVIWANAISPIIEKFFGGAATTPAS
jgi:beta-glucosidase